MLLCLSLLTTSVASQPDYQLDNLILMGVYVGLTLILAGAAIWSVFITRSALNASSEQSRKALEASENQSKAAIEAVNKQIEASERQTRETIEAVNKQIEASERQAQEALYNQHKPVIVPTYDQIEKEAIEGYNVGIQNKGTGVALNAYGVLAIKGLPTIYCSTGLWFLFPDKELLFTYKVQVDF